MLFIIPNSSGMGGNGSDNSLVMVVVVVVVVMMMVVVVLALEKSAAPGLPLLESEVKCLLFADDLVLLLPTKEGLQQHLHLLGPDSKSQ